MFMKRLLNTSSIAGSASVPMACWVARGTTRASSMGPAAVMTACQPGSTTVVAFFSAMTAGPASVAPGCSVSRTYRPASSQRPQCMRTVASGGGTWRGGSAPVCGAACVSPAPTASTDTASITSTRSGIRNAKRCL